jgi:hypothetical protein
MGSGWAQDEKVILCGRKALGLGQRLVERRDTSGANVYSLSEDAVTLSLSSRPKRSVAEGPAVPRTPRGDVFYAR